MRTLLAVAVIGVSTLAGQHVPVINSGPRTQPAPGAYRFGNILFPGGIAPHQRTHAGSVGAVVGGGVVGGGPGRGIGGPRFPHTSNRNRTLVVPYAVPVYYGDPYGYGYGYQQQQPNVTVVMPQQPTPSVVINHNYTPESANPVMRSYSNEPSDSSKSNPSESGGLRVYNSPSNMPKEEPKTLPKAVAPPSDKPTIFLIALRDSTIRQAIGYWIENESLHYVTPQSAINQIPLDNVDAALSRQLNAERSLDFDLETARR
jgi:hypothetical protein